MRVRLLLGWVVLACWAAAAGCAARSSDRAPRPAELLPSLQATTFGDSVQFVLQITNTTEAPIDLEFASGRQFDFVVEREGSEVWRWSADRMFTQAFQNLTLAPGETVAYSALWRPAPALQGEFSVRGILAATRHRVEQRARFRIP